MGHAFTLSCGPWPGTRGCGLWNRREANGRVEKLRAQLDVSTAGSGASATHLNAQSLGARGRGPVLCHRAHGVGDVCGDPRRRSVTRGSHSHRADPEDLHRGLNGMSPRPEGGLGGIGSGAQADTV